MQASFDYQWRDEYRAASGESRSPLTADPIDVGSDGHGTIWQNHSLDVPFRQETTNWNGRLLARYTLPYGVAVSGNVRYQSGWPWAPIQRVSIPGSGTQAIFLSNLDENRSEAVTLADFRIEKAFELGNGSAPHRDGGRVQRLELQRGHELQPPYRLQLQRRDCRARPARGQDRASPDFLTAGGETHVSAETGEAPGRRGA